MSTTAAPQSCPDPHQPDPPEDVRLRQLEKSLVVALVTPEVGDDTLIHMASVDLRTGGVDAITFRDMGEARAWIRR